jgi:hypothetical protein
LTKIISTTTLVRVFASLAAQKNPAQEEKRLKERHKIAVRPWWTSVLRAGDLDVRFASPGARSRVFAPTRKFSDSGLMDIEPKCRFQWKSKRRIWCWWSAGVLMVFSTPRATSSLKRSSQPPGTCRAIEMAADPCHWGQVKAYAYLLACEQKLAAVTVRLTYYHLDSRRHP